ncbi:PAS domain S-box protein [Prosthecobacter sp.]|uniref:PAS domain S-box protein n=1 Tax=Prosthecobacter sp. TaxID=1965333 RepID=UPI002AB9BA99|nr:PAS domain S-box protein [Prosthecobacter sp.]MDZ4405151.1 PAS domain S-box protein [Prosthecobacter sp.]
MKTHKSRPAALAPTDPDSHRLVVEDLTETICRFLPDGTFTYVNEVYCRLFGKTTDELIGSRWQPVAVADDLPMIEEKLRVLSPENPVVVIENRIHDGQGQVRWMQFVNRGLFDASGHLVEMQSVGRDISERVLAERKLEESQQRWRFALESSGFGVWDWDIEHDRLFFSSQWKAMIGYEPQDAMPGNSSEWQAMMHPGDWPGVLSTAQEHLEGRSPSLVDEFRLRCKDGSWKWVLSRGRVIERDALGRPSRMIGTTEDISKRKAAEEREAHSLRMIAEGAPSTAVLEAITRNVEAGFPGMRCSVMLVDASGTRLQMKTAPGLPDYAREAIDGMLIAPNVACCGAAAYSGMRVICPNVLADARMEPFHKLALKANLRACWSEPILSSAGKVLGTLACYHPAPHDPSQTEIQTVANAARLAGLAIEREWKEQALRISEERYARALRGTTDGLWDWNIVTGDVYLSPRWKQMLGFEENELKNNRESSFLSRLHPDDVPKVHAARKEHFERRAPYQVECRLLTKAGDYRWFLVRGQADWNENGEAVRMTGTISDITERKLAEQALEVSEQRFRAVFEQAAVGIAVIETSTGRYLDLNQRMCEINHRTREEMLKLTFMEVTHPDDLQDDLNQMQELKEGTIYSFNMEKRNVAPDGALTWINLTVAPMWRPGEPPLRHIAVVEDIHERKQAEFNYRRELAYNQALVNHTSAFIFVMDVEGRFLHCNAAFFTTMGYKAKEVIGKTPWEIGLMDAQEVVRSKERFARLLRGEDNPPTDVRLRTKSGEWRAVEVRSTSTRKPDGSPDRIVITGTDMTERNRLQREVLRVIEQEQARVGHDLHDGVGQTMTGMVIMMEALEAELNGEAKAHALRIHELMNESVSEVRRMSHGLSPTSVKYRGLEGALNLLAETVRTNFRTPCSCDVEATIAINNEDKEAHLFRIAQEAVNNALRHGRPGEVKISLRGVGPCECELRVEDDGTGMRKSKARKENGNDGIGMRVMEYRANLIGGRLKIHNKPKKGVIVTCRFECDAGGCAPAPVQKRSAK